MEEWIDLDEDSTMMGCVVKALEKNGYEQTGAENNYISSIQGLGEFDGGSMSGWMGTLNDWFTNRGFGDFTVAAGTLGSGDEIRIMYTRNGYGADLGGSWDNHIKTVKALTFSAGELSPAFDPDTHEYTLTVDKGTDSVLVTPTASNKNYQVRTYVGETEYKRTAMVPTVDGTTITVKCGDPSWPNMNNDNEPAQVYTVNVKVKSDDKPVTPTNTKVLVRAQDGGAWLHQPMVRELTGGEAEKYGYTDKVEGVSALDALVVSHELTFGDDFTPETAKDFLEVSSSGFITKLYGTETYVCGFYVNAGYPNDGTKAPSGPGYNGTTVVNTKLNDGDTVDFFFYADDTAYSDYYTWIDVPETMVTGEAITVTVKGFYAVEGYRYKDAAELKAAARPLEGVGLAWVDADGYIKPIKDVVTDEDGQATFTVGSEATGYLVAQSGGDVYALMNPSDYIRKVAGKPVKTLGLTIRSQADNAYLHSMDKEVEVASNTAEKYGFTDKVEGVSVLDALVAAHELVYGDKFTPATAKQYLAIDPNTDWESKVFGRETGFHGFYINNDFPTNEAGAARPKVTDTKLLDAEAKLADLKAVDAVEKLIDAIGTVTLDSEEAIKAARGAYDALTDAQKEQVGNYQTLLDAEVKLADLQAADAVEKLIDAIGTVTLDSEEAIKAARDAYDALTDAQKELVGNYQTLLDAEAKLADLKAADAVEKLIDAIGTVTLDSEEAIKAARGAYDALTEEQQAQVGNYQTLLDAEAKLAQLKKDAEKPSQPEQPEKPATGDAGVALWLTVMCMTTLLGAALVGKKRKA